MVSRPSFAVRLGLLFVRSLIFLKSAFLRVARFFLPFLSRASHVFLRLLIPFYRVFFFAKKNMTAVYRPVKNRFMYFVSNRFSFYVLVIFIAVIGGITNIQVNAVRAEADEVGQRSILYALATNERMDFIEEMSDPRDARSFIASLDSQQQLGVFSDVPQDVSSALSFDTTPGLFRADGAFAFADITNTSPVTQGSSGTSLASAPRTEIITYAVESGDTLSTIAQKFGLNLNTVLWANNLTVRSVLKPGQELTILPVSGVVHSVKSGDTLLAIAKKYNVESSVISSYNNFSSDVALQVGQQFIIPGGVITATTPRPATTTTTVAVKDIFTSAPSGSQGKTTPSAGASMVWPTDLSTLVRGMSWFHTGYDIDCNGRANGTSTNDNYAADSGVVLFAGVKRGYGNTVEIDHGNGLITRYGHFYSLYVEAGETVSAGDPLGRCGSTGNSTGTHLHFEVIDSATKKFLNPANYIRY